MSSNDLAHDPRRTTSPRRTGLVATLVAVLAANALVGLTSGATGVVLHTVTGAVAIVLVVLLVRTRRHAV